MTETNTAITEAIAKCGELKARLETLQDMLKHKPALCIESITRPGEWWKLCSEDELADCPEGTVIEASDGWNYYRLGPARENEWQSDTGREYTHSEMWNGLIADMKCHVTFKYSGNF